MHILFLCTANYYRSRLAEALFNHYAREQGKDARATSAGIQAELWRSYNPGAISTYTLEALDRFGVPRPAVIKQPDALLPAWIDKADRTIAMSRSEHVPMIQSGFPAYQDRIEFWEVEDLHLSGALPATELIRRNVLALVEGI